MSELGRSRCTVRRADPLTARDFKRGISLEVASDFRKVVRMSRCEPQAGCCNQGIVNLVFMAKYDVNFVPKKPLDKFLSKVIAVADTFRHPVHRELRSVEPKAGRSVKSFQRRRFYKVESNEVSRKELFQRQVIANLGDW